jgi:hypothetical protein
MEGLGGDAVGEVSALLHSLCGTTDRTRSRWGSRRTFDAQPAK